jgi:hypothetical protein
MPRREKRLYYVTVRNGDRTGWLLGPYRTHREALANVERGDELACEADRWAWFYAYGTASLPADVEQPKTVFGV